MISTIEEVDLVLVDTKHACEASIRAGIDDVLVSPLGIQVCEVIGIELGSHRGQRPFGGQGRLRVMLMPPL